MKSRMRERRTYGSVKGLWREPLVYSTIGKLQKMKNRYLRRKQYVVLVVYFDM